MIELDNKILDDHLEGMVRHLLDLRNSQGFWKGHLSSSALSTSTAVFALGIVDKQEYRLHIRQGLQWLSSNVNKDGGWGDTDLSDSNISTTILCWS
ncbi:MAG: prenyltransferase/squalene oxidase repeat-containing protein, partial [Planctomycetota bacterium]